jgi:hypothetical protein
VQRSDPGIAAPGEDQFAGTAGPDQLVVDHVRGHPDQGQVTPPLPDHLAAGGERDEVREAFHRHRITIVDGPRDGVGE